MNARTKLTPAQRERAARLLAEVCESGLAACASSDDEDLVRELERIFTAEELDDFLALTDEEEASRR